VTLYHGRTEAPAATEPSSNGLVEPLLTSLEALAAAGHVDAACRLAGQACAVLRRSDPRGAHRFNALLHRLTRHLDW
jgi:hypothetical protein